MVVHFRNKKLEKVFATEKELIRSYGVEQGRMLGRRMTELRAARCLAYLRLLPQLRVHELTGDRKGQISITVRQPYRLIILAANEPRPSLSDGGLDWTLVTEVTVLEVVNYHD